MKGFPPPHTLTFQTQLPEGSVTSRLQQLSHDPVGFLHVPLHHCHPPPIPGEGGRHGGAQDPCPNDHHIWLRSLSRAAGRGSLWRRRLKVRPLPPSLALKTTKTKVEKGAGFSPQVPQCSGERLPLTNTLVHQCTRSKSARQIFQIFIKQSCPFDFYELGLKNKGRTNNPIHAVILAELCQKKNAINKLPLTFLHLFSLPRTDIRGTTCLKRGNEARRLRGT